MFFSLLLACSNSVVVGDAVKDDTTADTGASTDTGEVIEDTTPPEPETVWDEYAGARTFSVVSDWASCEESTDEDGAELLSGDEFEQIMDLCPSCQHVFENDPVETSLCWGGITLGTTWRALALDEDLAGGMLYFYLEGDAGLYEWSSAPFDFGGELIEFEYSFELWDYLPVDVWGDMAFAMALPA
jgi:hypothetical protein